MFKSIGEKHFEQCTNKRLAQIRLLGLLAEVRLDCPTARAKDLRINAVATNSNLTRGLTTYEYPVQGKQYEFVAYDNLAVGQQDIAKVAGVVACANCPFYNMTPVQVAQEQAYTSLSEAERVRAAAALQTAQEDVRAINARYQVEL